MTSFASDYVGLDDSFLCQNGHCVTGLGTSDLPSPDFRRFAIKDGRWVSPAGEPPLTATIKINASCHECPMVWWGKIDMSWTERFEVTIEDDVIIKVERVTDPDCNARPMTPDEQAKSWLWDLRQEGIRRRKEQVPE
jgi:hypothetical protein